MLDNYKMIAYLVIGVIVIGVITASQIRLHYVEKQRDQALLEKQVLLTQVAEQNAAIADFRAKGKEKELELRNAELMADKRRQAYEAEADKILASNVSKQCVDAVRWGAVKASEIAKSWN